VPAPVHVLARLKRVDDAIAALGQAADIDPGSARYGYVYAIALNSAGRVPDALAVLKRTSESNPRDRDTLAALIGIARDSGDIATALTYAERMAAAFPDDRKIEALVQALKSQSVAPP
jgi:Flp pilus assembly protein TadD